MCRDLAYFLVLIALINITTLAIVVCLVAICMGNLKHGSYELIIEKLEVLTKKLLEWV
jgi:hypothetical protein